MLSDTKQRYWIGFAVVAVMVSVLYGLTVYRDFGSADTFEFQVTAPTLGIAHPTGYPLYLLLGKLWTLLPFGTVAFRLNVGTAFYAIVTCLILYSLIYELFERVTPAVLAALLFAVTPTFWSQAVEAEVYSLHTVFVSGILLMLAWILGEKKIINNQFSISNNQLRVLFLLCGLGMTNHVTTILLAPAILIALIFAGLRPKFAHFSLLITHLPFLLLPALLYTYLPLRWQAVNNEPMGIGRWLEWMTGQRFQGALVWRAWLDDPGRYTVVGQLFAQEWAIIGLIAALLGFIALFIQNRQFGIIILLAWLAFSFYGLNYYVPDLNVFLLPAHICLAIALGSGFGWLTQHSRFGNLLASVCGGLLLLFLLREASTIRTQAITANPLRTWGESTLALPLAPDATILADSEKHPPLYYLQQAETLRPDLNIMVLPDEAAYRAELDTRLQNGETVYLARFLPRLPYALRSVGPLIEVMNEPVQTAANPLWTIKEYALGVGAVTLTSGFAQDEAGVSIKWLPQETINENLLVHFRWIGNDYVAESQTGQVPLNTLYPTNAWQPNTAIDDFYLLPHPIWPSEQSWTLEIALAPPFTHPSHLIWNPLDTLVLPAASPVTTDIQRYETYNVRLNNNHITAARWSPPTVRPNNPIFFTIQGKTSADTTLTISVQPEFGEKEDDLVTKTTAITSSPNGYEWQFSMPAPQSTGQYNIFATDDQGKTEKLSIITVGGSPLPDTAINYSDEIALLTYTLPTETLTPSTAFEIDFTWLHLNSDRLTDDYTLFAQIVNADDLILAQADVKPRQGTYPTNLWQDEETINDTIRIQLPDTIPDGDYRLYLGWYTLIDLSRLQVLDAQGNPIADKLIVDGLAP